MARARHGHFLKIPYDLRRPTLKRARSTWWNPKESRILVPKVFGWGYDINFGALWGLITRRR